MGSPGDAYLSLAESLSAYQGSPSLFESLRGLPDLDAETISRIVEEADVRALTAPRRGWELLLLLALAGHLKQSPGIVRAEIDLRLSLLASHWGVPRRSTFRARRAGRIFNLEGRTGMEAAACIALNFAPWTRPNFLVARDELDAALEGVRAAKLPEWTAHGLHALAFAEMLTGKLESARGHLLEARRMYEEMRDAIGALRVTYTEGGWYRRSGQADQSYGVLTQLLAQFEQLGARPDAAKTRYQLGINELVRASDYPKAMAQLEVAEAEFLQLEMDLWAAQAQNGQAQAAANQGQLTRARTLRQKAIKSFSRHATIGLQADSLTDQARLHYMHGDVSAALGLIRDAIGLYEILGAKPSSLNAQINMGRFLLAQSRYQLALQTLEQVKRGLEELNNPSLLAFCQLQIGNAWLGLGNTDRALVELQLAADGYERSGRPGLQAEVLQATATLQQRQGKLEEASGHLNQALDLVTRSGDVQVQVSVLRQLGENTGFSDSPARQLLEQSLALARELGLELELAAALAALGEVEASAGHDKLATLAWQEALQVNEGVMPEIEVRSYIGLARLAERSNLPEQALASAHKGLAALKRIRRDFWQPQLAGSYAWRWQADATWAVTLAARMEDVPATLNAIEAGKAQVFVRQELDRRVMQVEDFPELQSSRAEVFWLMDQLRVEPSVPGRRSPRRKELTAQVVKARKAYDALMDRAERMQITEGVAGDNLPLGFDLDHLRAGATSRYGLDWLAMDFHLSEQQLVCAWVSSSDAGLATQPVRASDHIALDACRRMDATGSGILTQSDLERLGTMLIPYEIEKQLSPDTTLLIAAHDLLHDVPWAAIRIGPQIPLVTRCQPVMVPSLEAWQLLNQRPERPLSKQPAGLLLAVAEFDRNFPSLPGATREADLIERQPGLRMARLSSQNATPAAFLAALEQPESDYDFLHLATHLVADRETGRMSGIVFPHETMLLDELDATILLPDLVVLSGCNGMRALTFPGDERRDFVSAFLLAGAKRLIGSKWKLADEHALPIIGAFYRQLASGQLPHVALAAAQRELFAADAPWTGWGGFQFVGV